MSNGMKVKGMAYTELPVVQFAVYLNSGMLCEPKGKSGLARLTAAVLNCGTRTKTPEELEVAFGLWVQGYPSVFRQNECNCPVVV